MGRVQKMLVLEPEGHRLSLLGISVESTEAATAAVNGGLSTWGFKFVQMQSLSSSAKIVLVTQCVDEMLYVRIKLP